MSIAIPPVRFRRFRDCRFDGSCCVSQPASYHVTVWGRNNRRIMGTFIASSPQDGIRLVRLLLARYPTRMIGISRTVYGGRRRSARDEAPVAQAGSRSFRSLAAWTRSRKHPARIAVRADVFEALASPERLPLAWPAAEDAPEGMRKAA